ncbi:MAG: AAA family ATPase [bacterium]|nr:AAA family ATPase [bacterium]
MDRFVLISGCSGGGKSTLLAELRRRGHAVVEEPGRRIVAEEQAGDGATLPWIDPAAFARRAIAMALGDRAAAPLEGWAFFDRGLIDAAVALEHLTGEPVVEAFGRAHRYHRRVFLAPPWPEIHVVDQARRHGLEAAVAEYERLRAAYPALGYDVVVLPRTSVFDRADFVLRTLDAP